VNTWQDNFLLCIFRFLHSKNTATAVKNNISAGGSGRVRGHGPSVGKSVPPNQLINYFVNNRNVCLHTRITSKQTYRLTRIHSLPCLGITDKLANFPPVFDTHMFSASGGTLPLNLLTRGYAPGPCNPHACHVPPSQHWCPHQ